jgi:hypothetical protein
LPARSSDAAARLLDACLRDTAAWRKLNYLCRRIGHRLSGSPGLTRAIDWAAEEMRKDGLVNVQKLAVMTPHWERGKESAYAVAPESRKLTMLGFGGSEATPARGIVAEVAVVRSFEELQRIGRGGVEGKIVVYNVPFAEAEDRFEGYGKTARYRTEGASRAAALGAVASLTRSLTPSSRRTAHTGAMRYDPAQPKIPAAAISIDDAEWLSAMAVAGRPVRVRLKMSARWYPDARSANVIGELRGRERPQEVVVLGGHLDSWDVGQGAHDDASGCVAAMQAVATVRRLGLVPARTLRVVLWTNEENGTAGAAAYRQWIGDEVRNHAAAIEMDMGAERPIGFGCSSGAAGPDLDRVRRLLEPAGAGQRLHRGGGTDLGPLIAAGVPGFWPVPASRRYFDWHHSAADVIDNVGIDDFRRNLAVVALLAHGLADMPGNLV